MSNVRILPTKYVPPPSDSEPTEYADAWCEYDGGPSLGIALHLFGLFFFALGAIAVWWFRL